MIENENDVVPAKPVLILGIGNILLRDEGVGVRTIEAMAGLDLPEGVETLDGGTSGADLVYEVAGRRKLIVIDATDAQAAPGAVFRLTLDDLLAESRGSISLHELGLTETLTIARQLGCPPREVVIFAVQPKVVEFGLELSDEVKGVLPRLIDAVLAEARRCPADCLV